MDVKHQVFVSSTYKDLIDERREVIHALLELDCIPAGMELFPATDEDAWSLIKEIIDGCDYYVLILGGKYGSVNTEGIGFTEMEYDYAVESQKPILVFLYEDLDKLPVVKVEKSEIGQTRLNNFREKVGKKHCKFWNSPQDLGGKVSRSLVQLRKKHPSEGWIPGRFAADTKMLREYEEMRARLAELERDAFSVKAPPGTEDFSQGEDVCGWLVKLLNLKWKYEEISLEPTWDKLFSYCGSTLMGECDDQELEAKIKLTYWHAIKEAIRDKNNYREFILPYVLLDEVKIQFQALGLITTGEKNGLPQIQELIGK